MGAEAKLKQLGITLPDQSTPVANYVPSARVGTLLFLSGHGPFRDGKTTSRGKLGKELSGGGVRRGPRGRGPRPPPRGHHRLPPPVGGGFGRRGPPRPLGRGNGRAAD